jgi:LmbE family N-acetylglucosaminyl deacetylase
MRKGRLVLVLAVSFLLCLSFSLLSSFAREETARDLTAESVFSLDGFTDGERATDGKAEWGAYAASNGGTVKITCDIPIGALYMRFNELSDPYVLVANGKQMLFGKDLYLHEYLDLEKTFGEVKELTLYFHTSCNVSEITVLSEGKKPENMQIWEPVCTDSDLLLFSSHSDDDQLFFAGVIPRYCAEGYRVQVAYLTNHPDWPVRRHELLDGLWAAGCKNYPVMGTFADFRKDDLEATVAEYENLGVSYEELSAFVVETIRQTRPSVVVSHDVNGEYGHGMHLLLSKMVREQTPYAADASAFPASAKEYGTWQVKKTYIHLYTENESGMVLDIDTPLDYFGGKTAFQVSQASFLNCHPSQHGGWYFKWQQGTEEHRVTSSKELDRYNPAFYGLYQSTVGADVIKTDFFENLKSKERMEEEARLLEEAERLEKEQREANLQRRLLAEQNKTRALACALCVVAAVSFAGILLMHLRNKKQNLKTIR